MELCISKTLSGGTGAPRGLKVDAVSYCGIAWYTTIEILEPDPKPRSELEGIAMFASKAF